MISLHGLGKTYGDRTVLHDLTLEIAAGGIFGLLGPNGAGKTTLLRIVMGVLAPSAGSAVLFGGLAPGSRDATRRIGYMPQELALYDGLTVLENVVFFGHMYGLRGPALRSRATELVAQVELADRGDSVVGTLSGGMRRRVMLATALVHRPRLVILDEPTAGVDPLLRLRFWDWFAKLAAEGVTVIVTTHHISEASHCGEVLFLREGAVLERGTPAELTGRYGAADLEAAFVAATRRSAVAPDAPAGSDDPAGSDPPAGREAP